MSSTMKLRVLLCTLGIVVGATLGCRPSSQTEPARDDVGAASIPEPSPDEAAPEETADTAPETTDVAKTPVPEPADEAEQAEMEEEAKSLGIGDPAPPLAVSRWAVGEPLEGLESGQVYVVEFWATWCPPCRTSMPHLSQLQEKYGDEVRFVGVTDEEEDVVQGFLEKEASEGKTWKEVVKYRLAIDAENATSDAYMRAAGQDGIPTAFIIGADGVVDWIGHPMAMDEPLAKIVAGEWDRDAAIARFEQEKKREELVRVLRSSLVAEEWDEALAALEQLEKETGPSSGLSRMRLSLLEKSGQTEAASKLRAELVEQYWDDASVLNEVAWGIASASGERDLEMAFKAATRASALRDHKDPSILDTLARVHHERGQLDEAIEWQKKALEQSGGHPSIGATLKKYEAEKAAQSAAPEEPKAKEEAKPDSEAP